jgi:D-alanyl-D-alanine carboxypeptidase/D-alanyl-D-alanine-endopeptidase (penicillin-binding protein 4)
MKKTLLIVVLKTFLSFNSFSQDFLNSSLINFLKSPEISNSIVGLQLQNQSGKILLSNNPKKSLIPASLQKLFTTAYVLNKLPLDFTFKTLVLSDGLIDTNTNILYGNLIISTSGDPSLESRIYKSRSFIKDLRLLMLKLKIKSIEGKVVLKPLETDYQVNNQWLWSDLGNYYGSGYSSHTFRDNYVEVFFNSGKEIGEPTEIIKIDPKIDSFHLINKVIVGESNRDLSYAYGAPLDENRLVIGTIPANKENFKVKISMHNPQIFLQ